MGSSPGAPAGGVSCRSGAARRAPLNILFLTTVWPGARRGGGEIVSQAFIDALRAVRHHVVVISYRRPGERATRHPADVDGGERAIETRHAGLLPLLWGARALAMGLPYSAAKYVSRRYRRRVHEALHGDEVIVFDHAQTAWLLRDVPRPHVYIAHNIEHHLYRQHAGRGVLGRVYAREARLARALEIALIAAADETWALSNADAAELRRIAPGARVRTFAPPPLERAASEPDTDVVLLGTWTWEANAIGLEWFLDRVVPHLDAKLRVEIAGAGSERYVREAGRVRARGVVDDAAAFLARGRVVAVPSRAGAGIQVKTLDAIASGRRVVATPHAVRGLGDLPPTVAVADDPAAFAMLLADAAAGPPPDGAAIDAWSTTRMQRFQAEVNEAIEGILGDRDQRRT